LIEWARVRVTHSHRSALACTSQRLVLGGNEPVGSSPEEFAALFQAELKKFTKLVKEAKIPAQD